MIFALRQTKRPPILLWKIDVSSRTPPSAFTIENISLRNDTRLPSEKLVCLPASETFSMMLLPFCWAAAPGHPPLHYHLISGLQTGPPSILARVSISPLITEEQGNLLSSEGSRCILLAPTVVVCVCVCVSGYGHAAAYK